MTIKLFCGGVFLEKQLFWVVPNDERQAAIRTYLAAAGHEMVEPQLAKYLILPMPFSADKHGLRAILERAKPGAVLMAGSVQPDAYALAGEKGFVLLDYLLREELTLYNALATAEGAVLLLLRDRDETLFEANILITGYGRIAKMLAQRLLAFGARVTVAARSAAARAEAQCMGCKVVGMEGLPRACGETSALVNTVPQLIITREVLSALPAGARVFDLASAPGGVDFAAASALGIDAGLYPALPAQCAPVSAGGFVARTVLEIIEENKGVFS